MIRFILTVGILALLIAYPIIILLAIVFYIGYYCCCQKKPTTLISKLEGSKPAPKKKKVVVDEFDEWSAKRSAEAELDKKIKHEVVDSTEFKAESARINVELKEKQWKEDEELENERGKKIIRKKTTTKQPIVQTPVIRTLTNEEIFAALDEQSNGTATTSDDFDS